MSLKKLKNIQSEQWQGNAIGHNTALSSIGVKKVEIKILKKYKIRKNVT